MKIDENEELFHSIMNEKLFSASLSSPAEKQVDGISRLTIRPIEIKGELRYQVSEHYSNKVSHRNITTNECIKLFRDCFDGKFRQGVITTVETNYHILINKKGCMTVVKKPNTKESALILLHNKPKKHLLPEGIPVPFLVSLGIMSPAGKVVAKKYDKFRQINRFIEFVNDVLPDLPQKNLEIIDFGCGKASLTFALYHFLKNVMKREINITGLDLKKDVIEHCQALADQLGYSSLKFKVGDINTHHPDGKIDLMISLHACDTATDAALEKAVKWGADVILCVPCCQHELYNQVKSTQLDTMLRHGILKERFAALATDAARAELLTMLGYEVQVLEFIDMEHTPKNLLLRAVKKPSEKRQKEAEERYKRFKNSLSINPSLEVKTR